VLSRLAFHVVFAQARQRAKREPKPVALAFFDVDHFKAINDRFGHAAGDAALAGVADRLRNGVRSGDGLCRWGGEEFVLLLEDCDLNQAREVADKARLAVASRPLSAGTAGEIALTVSAGVAELRPGEDAEGLIGRADAALYAAKAAGRNRPVCAG
jgi:diguanylate cyclase (GGDEF)-like protein